MLRVLESRRPDAAACRRRADHVDQQRLGCPVGAEIAAAQYFDSQHLRGGNALQNVFESLALGTRPFAVDQHITGRGGVAALVFIHIL